jgi:hypothetical protein
LLDDIQKGFHGADYSLGWLHHQKNGKPSSHINDVGGFVRESINNQAI